LSCACVSVSGVLFSVGVCVCVCDLLIFFFFQMVNRRSDTDLVLIFLRLGFCARIDHRFIAPPRALPTRLQYDCNTMAQYSTPLRPPVFMPIHYLILCIAISCSKGFALTWCRALT